MYSVDEDQANAGIFKAEAQSPGDLVEYSIQVRGCQIESQLASLDARDSSSSSIVAPSSSQP
jgi:hypothetical protein